VFNQHGFQHDSQVPDEQFLAVIRARIRKARLDGNHSQEEIASVAGLETKTYQHLENPTSNRKFNPRLETLLAVAQAVGTSVVDLMQPATPAEIAALEKPISAKREGRKRKGGTISERP
jgi:transcriptional regulator with XRE-family HTH domain